MAVLSLLAVAGAVYAVTVACISSRTRFGLFRNKLFAPTYPDIEPPALSVNWRNIVGLCSTIVWPTRWPSVVEIWMAFSLVPLLLVPYPIILNNMLEWMMYLIFGNSDGDGSHSNFINGAPPIRLGSWPVPTELRAAIVSAFGRVYSWLSLMWHGREPTGILNTNNSLLCYLQSVSWGGMHELPDDVLQEFPTPAPNSRVNAVMMARCATTCYDRWHNVDQAVSLRWNKADPQEPSPWSQKYSLVKAWRFDRVTLSTSLEPLPKTQSSSAAGPASSLQGEAIAGAPTPDNTTNQHITGNVSVVSKALLWLQQTVTAVSDHAIFALAKVLQKLVWFWAGAGEPGTTAVRDESKFTSVKANACLLKVVSEEPGGKVVALVLAFTGTEALQSVHWISDLAQVNPPPNALDPKYFPLGFTHPAFRDALGLKRNLQPADDLQNFSSSYLVYEPNSGHPASSEVASSSAKGFKLGPSNASDATAAWKPGKYIRIPDSQEKEQSPFVVITQDVNAAVISALKEFGPGTTVKVFITGHSLGGALAHLYTGALLLHEPESRAAKNFEAVYTFGAPRVGSRKWVRLVEDKLKDVPGDLPSEDRFQRVVNALDIVPRLPPSLDGLYQHPGHCVLVQPYFAMARPALFPGDRPSSAMTRLTQTPELSLETVLCAGDKLALSALLLFSTAVLQTVQAIGWLNLLAAVGAAGVIFWPVSLAVLLAVSIFVANGVVGLTTVGFAGMLAFVFWPDFFSDTVEPVLVAVHDICLMLIESDSCLMLIESLRQPVQTRPRLFNNPIYLVTRMLAFLGPAPIVALLDVLLLPVLVLFAPVLWWTAFVEPVLLFLLFIFMPPVMVTGLFDHSMAEYYTACEISTDVDWGLAEAREAENQQGPDEEGMLRQNMNMSTVTIDGLSKWLDNQHRGSLQVDGEWLKQQPQEVQQVYVNLLVEHGFLQLGETDTHILLVSPMGLTKLQQSLDPAADNSASPHMGRQQQQGAGGGQHRSIFSSPAGEDGSAGKDTEASAKAAVKLAEGYGRTDKCLYHKLSVGPWLSSMPGVKDHQRERLRQREREDGTRSESGGHNELLDHTVETPIGASVHVYLNLLMQACSKCPEQGSDHTIVCLKVSVISAIAIPRYKAILLRQRPAAAGLWRSLQQLFTIRPVAPARGSEPLSAILDNVQLSLRSQVPSMAGLDSSPFVWLETKVKNEDRIPVLQDKVDKLVTYKFKERSLTGSLSAAMTNWATIGGTYTSKEGLVPGAGVGTLLELVAIITKGLKAVEVRGSATSRGFRPCSVQLRRYLLPSLLCSRHDDLSTLSSVDSKDALYFEICVPNTVPVEQLHIQLAVRAEAFFACITPCSSTTRQVVEEVQLEGVGSVLHKCLDVQVGPLRHPQTGPIACAVHPVLTQAHVG